jgi:tripartite-type tricarboxylate transporter receptor subunit TctC
MRTALLLLLVFIGSAFAQGFPAKPVRLVVGYPPAGPADLTARLVAGRLQEAWGQSVIVDNKPGASAMIAGDLVARAAPDGYTLLLGTIQSHAMNAGTIRKMLYDPVRDFTAISQVTRSNWVLAANAGVNASSLSELIALAKARPGELTYGSSGIGSVSHLAFEILSASAGVQMTHIPYKGTAQAVSDVVEGRVRLVIGDPPLVAPQIKAGRLKAIAMTADFDVLPWQGIFGPAGMAPELVRKIHGDLVSALRSPEIEKRFAAAGLEAVGSSPEQFAAHVKRELGRWSDAARKAGIQPE